MAKIKVVIEIDEPGLPRETLETYVADMKERAKLLAQAADLGSAQYCLPATIVGVAEPIQWKQGGKVKQLGAYVIKPLEAT